MKRITLLFLSLLCGTAAISQDHPARPRILGIGEAHIYSSNIAAARGFYQSILSPVGPCTWCEEIPRSPLIIPLNAEQFVFVLSAPAPPPSDLLAEVTFSTDNLLAMKQFLIENRITFTGADKASKAVITLTDPEGHRIAFKQFRPISPISSLHASAVHLIHAGFVVRDRTAEEHFYKDVLGFRPYWHGGMKDDQTDWVSLQVPDGTDWVEFMVNVAPHPDHHTLGVMNHIALGVPDIHAEQAQLRKSGWSGNEQPKIGRDGKWQLNLYDPDDTRVEFMEFKPTEKPCCSEFTGPHPGPQK
jgi:catechol 2,3-dioxygenase-like lactoylglutathione lyase family enzyme